jgi:hypothetical protein
MMQMKMCARLHDQTKTNALVENCQQSRSRKACLDFSIMLFNSQFVSLRKQKIVQAT